MKVRIGGREYEYSFDSVWGVLYDFETLTSGKVEYNGQLMLHVHIAIYGVLIRKNSDFDMEFEDFVKELNNMELSRTLVEYYTQRMAMLTDMSGAEGEAEGEAKKKRKD